MSFTEEVEAGKHVERIALTISLTTSSKSQEPELDSRCIATSNKVHRN